MREREKLEVMLAETEKRLSQRDLFYLVKYVLGEHWEYEGASRFDEQHVELCRQLMGFWNTRKQRDKTIVKVEWPRRTLKSTVCSVGFPVWVLLNNPNTRILLDTAVAGNAQNFLKNIRTFFEGPYIQGIFGKLYSEKNDWNMNSITLNRTGVFPQPSIDTGGIDMAKTSQHYDLIISDDLQNKDNCKSKEQRDKVKEHFKLYANLIDPGGMILSVGTRWDFDDLSTMLDFWAKEDMRCLRPQRIFNYHKSCYKYDGDGNLSREPQFPTLLPQSELDAERAAQGAWVFSCNYLVRPQSDETAMFKKDWIQYHSLSEEQYMAPGWMRYLCVDPAQEGTKASADNNGLVVVAVSPNYDLYVLKTVNEKMTRLELSEAIFKLHDRYNVNKVGIESVFEQVELIPWMKEQAYSEGRHINFVPLKTNQEKKWRRIQALQPYFESMHVFLKSDQGELEDQILRYSGSDSSKSKKDDLVDSLAYVLQFLQVGREAMPKEYWTKAGWRELWNDTEKEAPDETTVQMWKWRKERNKKRDKKQARQKRVKMMGF